MMNPIAHHPIEYESDNPLVKKRERAFWRARCRGRVVQAAEAYTAWVNAREKATGRRAVMGEVLWWRSFAEARERVEKAQKKALARGTVLSPMPQMKPHPRVRV